MKTFGKIKTLFKFRIGENNAVNFYYLVNFFYDAATYNILPLITALKDPICAIGLTWTPIYIVKKLMIILEADHYLSTLLTFTNNLRRTIVIKTLLSALPVSFTTVSHSRKTRQNKFLFKYLRICMWVCVCACSRPCSVMKESEHVLKFNT